MTNKNPIAAALGIEPIKSHLRILGREYNYLPSTAGYGEGMYRHDAGHGVSNPCFSLRSVTAPESLGVYLSGRRDGVKKAEALAIVGQARGNVEIVAQGDWNRESA